MNEKTSLSHINRRVISDVDRHAHAPHGPVIIQDPLNELVGFCKALWELEGNDGQTCRNLVFVKFCKQNGTFLRIVVNRTRKRKFSIVHCTGIQVSKCLKFSSGNNLKYITEDRSTIREGQKAQKTKYNARKIAQKAAGIVKKKGCEQLSHWISSVTNHLWWNIETCKGDTDTFKEKCRLITNVNRHKFSPSFTECEHGTLDDDSVLLWLQ